MAVGLAVEACVRGWVPTLSFLRELPLSLRESSVGWTLASALIIGLILRGSLGSCLLDLLMMLFSA